jgi:ribosomal protein L3
VVDVQPADHLLFLRGSIPGARGQVVLIHKP